ncbi:NADPH-dependent FMN reductase [Peribacillus frigoritolerans]
MIKSAIQDVDGIIIVSPEYNSGMPDVLKNALD